jgi:hypothetical protein
MTFREPYIRCINRIKLCTEKEIHIIEAISEDHNMIFRDFGGLIYDINELIRRFEEHLPVRISISTHRSVISTLRISISTLRISISTLRSLISTLRSLISTYRISISTSRNTISTIRNTISTIRNSILSFIKEVFYKNKYHLLPGNAIILTINDESPSINLRSLLQKHKI